MKRISISAIMKDDEIEKFYFVAQKDNGFEVEGYFSLEELTSVISKVEKTQSFEEQKNIIINEKIKEEITKDVENIEKYKDLIERWKNKTKYGINEICKYNDIVFKCKKEHISDYEYIPSISKDYWEVVKSKNEKPRNPLLPKEKAQFYSSDLTYKKGDYVMLGSKVYQRIAERGNDGSPLSKPSDWKEIGEWED